MKPRGVFPNRQSGFPTSFRIIAVMLTIIASVFFLIVAKDILVPIVLGIFLALLLYPPAQQLEDKGVPRIVANLILILSVFAILSGVIFIIVKLFFDFSKDLPFIKEQLIDKLRTIQGWLEESIGLTAEQQEKWFINRYNMIFDNFGNVFGQVFTATTSTIFKVGILPVFTFMFLYYRDKFRRFLFKILPHESHNRAANIISEICYVTPSYLKGLLIVVGVLVIVNSTVFYFIGVRHPLFFGIVAALFNLIPYLGTIIGYLIAFIFVIGTQSMDVAVGLAITFLIVQFVENNILTPNITGVNVSINPLVTILAIIVGGMIWDLSGMFIVIPVMAIFKIFCDNVPTLKPYAFLIGIEGTEPHALTVRKVRDFFGRLFGARRFKRDKDVDEF